MATLQNASWDFLPAGGTQSRLNLRWWAMTIANEPNGVGGIRLRSPAFDTHRQSIELQFDYISWGGTGGTGLCIYLFDANAPRAGLDGAPGAGFGYKNMGGGYVGLLIDESGEFPPHTVLAPHNTHIIGAAADNFPYVDFWPVQQPLTFDAPQFTSRQAAIAAGGVKHVVAEFRWSDQHPGYEIHLSLNGELSIAYVPYVTPLPPMMRIGIAATNGPTHTSCHELNVDSLKLSFTAV